MLTNEMLNKYKQELKKMKAEEEVKVKRTDHQNIQQETGELSTYDNHPGDLGTELHDRERDQAIQKHSDFILEHIQEALHSIENGTYGQCEVCGNEIAPERLDAIPYTRLCIEHANEQSKKHEERATEIIDQPFEETRDKRAIDDENSFEEVAEYGTSDTISDDEQLSQNNNEEFTIESNEYDSVTNRNHSKDEDHL